jgi:TatD DNase family protein
MIDSHAHLDDEQFDADREAVVQRALAAGVETILCVGTTVAASRAAVRVAETHAGVYAAVGIHPNSCGEAAAGDWEQIAAMLDHPRVVGLGETGLDCYRDFTPLDVQREFLLRHLRLAEERDLPIIIHCRDAQAKLLPVLREAAARRPLRGVLHCFSGDEVMARECLALGLHLSFAGNVTYRNKKFLALRATAATVPADRLLVETDCPYLVPEPLRGKEKRNEPALLVHTVADLATLRGATAPQLARQSAANARQLFRLPGAGS